MFICPACGKLFSLESAMKGHLRLSNDNRHVAYTGRKISRKHVRVASSNLSKQTINDLLERMSNLEAKFNALNKPPQQPLPSNETSTASPYSPRKTDSIVDEVLHRLEAKAYGQNRPQQQLETSGNQSRSTVEVPLEYVSKQEVKDKAQNKPQQQIVIKTEAPVASQLKKKNWWDYVGIDKKLKSQSPFAPSDEYLNSLVESGLPPDYVKKRALNESQI